MSGTRTRALSVGGLAAALVAVAALAAPALVDEAGLRTLATVCMFGALAQGWNIIGGYAGYACFGNVVFFGLGAYTVAVLMAEVGWGFWPTLPVAIAVGAAFAAIIGLPLLRLRGHYFAIATLGVAEGTREVVLNLSGITGGGAGITVPVLGSKATTAYPGNTTFYYLFLAVLVVATATVFAVTRSRFGYALRAIHEDEAGAAATGIHTTRAKVAAFALCGAITAAAGALFAFQQVTIYPERLFSVEITVLLVVMAVIGGAGTVFGPVAGAFVLQLTAEYLRQRYLNLHLVVFGALIVIVVVFVPQGGVAFVGEAWRQRRVSLLDTIRRYRV